MTSWPSLGRLGVITDKRKILRAKNRLQRSREERAREERGAKSDRPGVAVERPTPPRHGRPHDAAAASKK